MTALSSHPLTTAAQLQIDVIGETCKDYLTSKFELFEVFPILTEIAGAFPDEMDRLDAAAIAVYIAMKQLELHRQRK